MTAFQAWGMGIVESGIRLITRLRRATARQASAATFKGEWDRGRARLRVIHLIPTHIKDETDSLVLWVASFVARSLQTAAGMRLARALPATQNPARPSLIFNARWNEPALGRVCACLFLGG